LQNSQVWLATDAIPVAVEVVPEASFALMQWSQAARSDFITPVKDIASGQGFEDCFPRLVFIPQI